MRIQYRSLLAEVSRLPKGTSSIDCALPTLLTVFSGALSVNGKNVRNGSFILLPANRSYILQTECRSTVAIVTLPKITSFQVGEFKVGL